MLTPEIIAKLEARGLDPELLANYGVSGLGLSTRSIQRFLFLIKFGDGCWEWSGSVQSSGYGAISVQNLEGWNRTMLTHRLAYELFISHIPDGLVIDHLCKNRLCCNPAQLEPVTLSENTIRGDSPVAMNARKTHCVNGHPLFGENVVLDRGKRRCVACRNKRAKEHYRRKMEQKNAL